VISPLQRSLPTQDNTTKKHKNKHPCSSGIRTHDPSNRAGKTYALDGAATGAGEAQFNTVKAIILRFKQDRLYHHCTMNEHFADSAHSVCWRQCSFQFRCYSYCREWLHLHRDYGYLCRAQRSDLKCPIRNYASKPHALTIFRLDSLCLKLMLEQYVEVTQVSSLSVLVLHLALSTICS
jgi:hypothetical protein